MGTRGGNALIVDLHRAIYVNNKFIGCLAGLQNPMLSALLLLLMHPSSYKSRFVDLSKFCFSMITNQSRKQITSVRNVVHIFSHGQLVPRNWPPKIFKLPKLKYVIGSHTQANGKDRMNMQQNTHLLPREIEETRQRTILINQM